ncbi:MAG: hypothetical protein Q9213_003227 [Squamulea squamosa]
MARTQNIAVSNGTTTNVNTSNGGQASSAKVGMISGVKNLYEGKPDSRGRSTWVDKYPDDLEEAAENAETTRYALLVRNKKSYDGRKKLEMDSIIVQSPLLKKSLGHVLNDYPGVTTSLDRLTFKAPFKPLVHRWANLVATLEAENDQEAKSHLDLFHRTMEGELQDDLKARDDYIVNKVITWSTCWMIFEPGTTVFAVEDKENRALRLKNGSYISTQCGPAFSLDCEYIDWDGEHFGLGSIRKLIYEFLGTKAISKLTAFPLQYHENLVDVKRELIERGRVFEKLSGYHYKHYEGVAVGQGAWGPIKYNVCGDSFPKGNGTQDQQVDSRIVLDTYAWNRFNPNRQVQLSALSQQLQHDVSPTHDDGCSDGDDSDYEDEELDTVFANEIDQPGQARSQTLKKDHLLLCSAMLRGYSLKNKKWRKQA